MGAIPWRLSGSAATSLLLKERLAAVINLGGSEELCDGAPEASEAPSSSRLLT